MKSSIIKDRKDGAACNREKIHVKVLTDRSEVVDYDESGIRLYLQTHKLSEYEGMRSYPHWHEEIEFMYILDGMLDYHVNGKVLRLTANSCTIINSRQINHSTHVDGRDCTFVCFLIHPALLAPAGKIWDRTVAPALRDTAFEYFVYDSGTPFHRTITEFMQDIVGEKTDRQSGYELRLIHRTVEFWLAFTEYYDLLKEEPGRKPDAGLNDCREMLTFIHQHYAEPLTLKDIAAAGSVCRSTCCEIFRHYLGTSPIDFLNSYRLEIAQHMLKERRDLSITEIALLSGFSGSGYFAQCYRKAYGMTPREARKGKTIPG